MTLPSSGGLTSTQIRTELGLGGAVALTVPNSITRNLAGKLAGSITWPNDFYGQTKDGICANTDQNGPINTVAGTVTHVSQAFGATAWNRKIICMVWWACLTDAIETTINSASIGGVSAAIHVQTGAGGSSALTNYGCAIISATVPTGAVGNVVVSFSNGTVRTTYVRTYRVTGSLASALHTGVDFAETSGAGTVTTSYGISTPANGNLLTASLISCNSGIGNISVTGNTEDFEVNDVTRQCRIVAAMNQHVSLAFRTITASGTVGATGRMRTVGATWDIV